MKGFIVRYGYFDNSPIQQFRVQRKKDESVFMNLFNDSLDALGQLYWYSAESPFGSYTAQSKEEMNYYYDAVLEDSEKFHDLFPPYSLLPKFARWIRDDNNLLFGFNSKPTFELTSSIFSRSTKFELVVANNVDVFLDNQDGFFWGVFSNNETLLNKCLDSALKVVEKKYVTELDLFDREKFYQGKL